MSTPGYWDLNPKIREYAILLNSERMPLKEIRERIRVRFGDAKAPNIQAISRLRMALGKGRWPRTGQPGNGKPAEFPVVLDRRYWEENADLRNFCLPLLRSHANHELCSMIRIVFGAEREPTSRQLSRLREFSVAGLFPPPAPTITTETWPEDHREALELRPVRRGEIALNGRRYWANRLAPFIGHRLFIGEHPQLRSRFFVVRPVSYEILCEVFPLAADLALEKKRGTGTPYELIPQRSVPREKRCSPVLSLSVREMLKNRSIRCHMPGAPTIQSVTCLGRQIQWKRKLHHSDGRPHGNPRYGHCRAGPCEHYLSDEDYEQLRGLTKRGFRLKRIGEGGSGNAAEKRKG